ncbi:MAG: cysteine--tRNA ligase [Propionibacteriaceae bacterium]|nr:cysteine--tRNA ligase [Propionibacteriaceae bacterium]
MSFQIYDEATGAVVPFEPIRPGEASIYHCGLTVQSAPHLGHIRKEVVFDVLRRWLAASGYAVRVVANVTDIDDKILNKSASLGMAWYELAYTNELALHRAYQALGCLPPNYEPRATGHIPEMIELVTRLIDAGHAYAADDGSGDVYFDVKSWSDYGELTRQKADDMMQSEDGDTRGKRDPRDFALWKGHKPDEPDTASWPSPWGRGRPGWHLECSAMAVKYLGEAFDIHGGGIDLRFPHHENELAQARAAGYPFAKYWMHNAFVTMAGEKMSKSLGNGAGVAEVTAQFPARAVRLYLTAPHYRSTIDLSDEALTEAAAQLGRIDAYLARVGVVGPGASPGPVEFSAGDLPTAFVSAMDDDLGTPAAVAVLFDAIKAGHKALDGGDVDGADDATRAVRAMLHVLGLDPGDPEWAGQLGAGAGVRADEALDGLVRFVLDERAQARANKDWAAADAIRDRLTELGVVVEDSPTGARWSLA